MKKRIFLASVLGASMLFFTSCKKDDDGENNTETTELSVTESKTTLDQTATSLKTDLGTMSENASMDALDSFSDLMDDSDDTNSNAARQGKKSVKDYIAIIEKTLNNTVSASNARLTADDDFDLSTSTGIYEWNASLEDFENKGTSSNLIIKFPSVEGGTTNDATFTVNSYKEDSDENPTDVDMVLTKGGNTIFSIDFEAAYDSESEPTSIDGTIKMTPYSYSLKASHTSNSVSFNTSINSDNLSIPIVSTSMNATFLDDSLTNPNTIKGSLQLYEVTLNADINAKAIQEADEETADMESVVNSNANVSFSKTSSGQKIGDVVVDEVEDAANEDTDVIFYIQYSDGSKEDLEEVFDETLTEIEEVIEELEDNDSV